MYTPAGAADTAERSQARVSNLRSTSVLLIPHCVHSAMSSHPPKPQISLVTLVEILPTYQLILKSRQWHTGLLSPC